MVMIWIFITKMYLNLAKTFEIIFYYLNMLTDNSSSAGFFDHYY